jgi:hypothetical protein
VAARGEITPLAEGDQALGEPARLLGLLDVVSMRSYSNSAVTRLRSSARRWDGVRLSLRWSLRCTHV